MTPSSVGSVPAAVPASARSSRLAGGLRAWSRNRAAVFGAVLFILIAVLSVASLWLPLADPDVTDPVNRLKRPLTDGAMLGTDHLGRDLLSRLLHGTRLSILVGLAAALFAAFIGSAIGLVAGFYRGWVDNWLMRSIDMLMAFPYILIALAIVAALGPGLFNALIAVAIVNIPFFARNIRGVTLTVANSEFVDAARLNGLGPIRIIVSEILPNVLPYVVVAISTTVGWMIVETAGLSFLGLGSQPPQADLGSMLGEGRKLLINAPHVSFVPGIMIFLLVISINLCGDGIRDALDPRLRRGALSRPAAKTHVAAEWVAAARHGESMLEVVELEAGFNTGEGWLRAINGVELSLERGGSLGLIGESGCGKSVTALSLTGLVASPPGCITCGGIYFDDAEILGMSEQRLRSFRGNRIAYVFQDPMLSLHPLFTLEQQLVEALQVHQPLSRRDARAEALDLLTSVRIENPAGRLQQYPYELSGGQRQRVAIAMALANKPDLLVADEPTTALDVTIQADILRLLVELRATRGIGLIFISHDIAVVSQLCERIAVMYAGEVVEVGDASAVVQAPAHPYTRALIDCLPERSARDRLLPTIPGLPPALTGEAEGCAFASRCNAAKERCRIERPILSAHAGVEVPVQPDVKLDTTHDVRCFYPLHTLTDSGLAGRE